MNNINLEKIKHVHFIGIGGIGVSAVARMMLEKGKKVTGSDASESRITGELLKIGAEVFIGHHTENISSDIDLAIYSIAVSPENPEMIEAKRRGIEIISYPEFLGVISKNYFTIAVSGTHGKTTTTAMVAKTLIDNNNDPTVIVGSLLSSGGSNFVSGNSKYFVVEACEYRRSFLNINPRILIITNIDNDHLDYYKDTNDIISAFHEFAGNVSEGGCIIADLNDKNITKALEGIKTKIIDFSKPKYETLKLNLKVPGEHNRKNARAVLVLVDVLGFDTDKAVKSLENFSGTWRRFEYKGKTENGAIIYDDYAHHPTEIKATILGAREKFPDKKLTIIFQPHLYSRTKLLFNDFISVLSLADRVIVTDIYAAREPNDNSITGKMLSDAVKVKNKNTLYISDFNEIASYLNKNSNNEDVLITMGAGDVYKVCGALVKVE